jgi:3-hydroxybutyryl-CoA dehydrogenase
MSTMNIGVIGGGLMGHGIAYLLAAAGHDVAIYEPSAEVRASIPQRLEAIAKLLDDDPDLLDCIAIQDRLAPAVAHAAFVFEAAPEKLQLKQQIFSELEKLTARDTILASNSSALPSTEIGRNLKHRTRVVGTHFWNPPHLVPLVEVVQTEWTSSDVIEKTIALLREAGRSPVHVRRDIPGFIGNRLQHALKREAIAMLADGVADASARALACSAPSSSRISLDPTSRSTSTRRCCSISIVRPARIRCCASWWPKASSACAPVKVFAHGRPNRRRRCATG